MEKMKNERIRYMKNYKKNQEILLSKPEQITIMSEIIEMSKKVNHKLLEINTFIKILTYSIEIEIFRKILIKALALT